MMCIRVLSSTLPLMALAGGTAAVQARVQERDSAGVRILTQRPAAVAALASRARFTRDGTEGGREPFHRVNGILALRDGIVVANAGTSELRYYDRNGVLRWVAGRRGSGPGEFRIITWIQATAGDTVLVYDGAQRRLSVWTRSGEHVRDVSVALASGRVEPGAFMFPPALLGMFSDRELFYIGSVSIKPARGTQRAMGHLVRANLAAQQSDTIARIPVIDFQFAETNRGSPMRDIAFPRMISYAFGSGEFSVSDGAEYQIDRYSRDGRMTSSIRVQRRPAAVSQRDRDLYIAEVQAENPADVVFGSEFPTYRALWYDLDGRLWAEQYRPPSAGENRWDVFDARGRLIVTVTAPSALRLLAADVEQVYGIHTDDLDVPTLRAFDLPPELKR